MSPTAPFFMDQGRIVEQGKARELFANPQQPRTRQFLEKNFSCNNTSLSSWSLTFGWGPRSDNLPITAVAGVAEHIFLP